MLWAVIGVAFDAASKDAGRAAENGITLFGAVMNVCAWSMYFYLKREQVKRRQQQSRKRGSAVNCQLTDDTP
jgi:hypothetical protein